MITQILAVVAFYSVIYGMFRFRHFVLAFGEDKQKYYRANNIGFDETDWGFDGDDGSGNEPGSQYPITAFVAGNCHLVEWPTELELQPYPSPVSRRGLTVVVADSSRTKE